MKIELNSYEVIDAVTTYLLEKYGLDADIDEGFGCPDLKYLEPEYTYRKTRDGKFKLDKYGNKIINTNKTKWHKKFIEFDDDCHLEFYI